MTALEQSMPLMGFDVDDDPEPKVTSFVDDDPEPVVSTVRLVEEPEPRFVPDREELELERALDGATFIFREPEQLPFVWGSSTAPLWVQGEALMLVGPDGVGKTTIAQQLLLARIGLRANCLGLTVECTDGRALYVAADRPRQAARSLGRMVRPEDAETVAERLVVWPGPLPFDLSTNPRRLADLAAALDVDLLFLDSLKDVALDLSKDETGSRVNLAVQAVIAAGVDVCVLHHQRKEHQGGGKPKRLSDVYGSRWLTAGMGSVVLLWGEPGDLVVEVSHLKQPAEEVGPLRVVHDHARGSSAVQEAPNLEQLLDAAANGLTVADAARLLFELDAEKPTPNQTEKARRRLEKNVEHGIAERRDDPDGLARYYVRAQ